jgi:hypothetical protein
MSDPAQYFPSDRQSFSGIISSPLFRFIIDSEYDGGALKQRIANRLEEAPAINGFIAVTDSICRFCCDNATNAVQQSCLRKNINAMIKMGKHRAVRTVFAGGQIEGQFPGKSMSECHQMLFRKPTQASQGSVTVLFCSNTAEYRIMNSG